MRESFDQDGVLQSVAFDYDDTFNFGFDVVDVLAEKCPDKTAMVWVSGDRSVTRNFTFGDVSRESSRAANYLSSLGVKKGDAVMLVLKRHHQFWTAMVALHKIGAVAIPATHQLQTKDYVYRFGAAGVRAIICTAQDGCCPLVEAAKAQYSEPLITVVANGERDGWHNYDKGLAEASDVFPRGPESPKVTDTMLMYFTSGTTGYPKIAAHNFAYALGHIPTARNWHNVDPDGLHFTVSDTGWGKAVWGKLYGQWLCEAAIFTYDFDKFVPDELLSMFAKHRITTFCAPPTIYRFFIKEDLSKYDLSSLQHTTTAGEALNPEVSARWLEATGLLIHEGFGQTETTLAVATLVGQTVKPGSMGKPNPLFSMVIVGAEDKPCRPGEVGEICIRTDKGVSPGMFTGYYRDAEKTAAAWHDGLYHTGDTAWMDEDGYYWYVGRTDDLIKSSGYRIGPFEIESVIMELPYVLECAVTGAPDPVRGQVVKATVVLAAGHTPSDALAEEIKQYVKGLTAPYKYPRIVEFVKELPKTISGKIRRVELRGEKGQPD